MSDRMKCPKCGTYGPPGGAKMPPCGCVLYEGGLFSAKQPDNFNTESPIRAFTTWTVTEQYALGKGFRPAVQHLPAYLTAMYTKEKWATVQVLYAENRKQDELTILFRKLVPKDQHLSFIMPEPEHEVILDVVRDNRETIKEILNQPSDDIYKEMAETFKMSEGPRIVGKHPALGMPYEPPTVEEVTPGSGDEVMATIANIMGYNNPEYQDAAYVKLAKPVIFADDPINPKHYAGRECADIGERLSANGYQILKYVWRLGKKDDPCQELGKAIWYGESEAALLKCMAYGQGYRRIKPNFTGLKPGRHESFLEDRIADHPTFTQNIARMLWQGYGQRELRAILEAINEHRFHMDCGRGLAV